MAEAFIVLAVFFGAPAYLVARVAHRGVTRMLTNKREQERLAAPWAPGEHSDGELYYFYCRKPGEDDIPIGHAAVRSPAFSQKVLELREERDDVLRTLNGSSGS
jgi:hypothetical protein